MREVVLVRHGQASFGTDDYDRLSDLGHRQAEWLGRWLDAHEMGFDQVIRGDLRRHRETLEGIRWHMALPQAVIDPRFDEFHSDDLQAQYIAATGSDLARDREGFLADFPEVFAAWESGAITGSGESYAQFQGRVLDGLAAIETERTLVVTSGGVITAILADVLGLGPRAVADLLLMVHNASVHVIHRENGRWRLSLFNASPHLNSATRTYI